VLQAIKETIDPMTIFFLLRKQRIGAHAFALCVQRSPNDAALSTSFRHAPQEPELNTLITTFLESYSSVSIYVS